MVFQTFVEYEGLEPALSTKSSLLHCEGYRLPTAE